MSPKLQRVNPLVPRAGAIYKGDALDRRPDCLFLRRAMSTAKTPCVLAVDAAWGAGKTVFLQMLQEECKAENMPCVYFDAWKADFHNDALPAMIGEIEKQIAPKGGLEKSIQAVGRALKSPEIYAGLMKMLGAGQAAEVAAETLRKMGAESNAVAEYTRREKAMEEFRNELCKFAAPKNGKPGPLVFFVDELDRCRPVFAVEVLEKIKHTFNVEGVFFVLAVNKAELQKTILSVYGEIDSERYLRRFFDFEFRLENRGGVVMAALERCGYDMSHIPDQDRKDLIEFLPLMCKDFGLSPRDQEQAAALVAHALSMTPEKQYFYSVYTAFFVALKFAKPELYQQCVTNARQDPANFPFAEILEYYDSMTGAQKAVEEGDREKPQRWALVQLCALRYHNDSAYADKIREAVVAIRRREIPAHFGQRKRSLEERVGMIIEDGPHDDLIVTGDPRPILEKIELGEEERKRR